MERIVRDGLVMPDMLEGELGPVTETVSFPFNHPGVQMEIAETQPGIAPGAIPAQHAGGRPFPVAGVRNLPVQGVSVRMGILVGEPAAPEPAVHIAVGCQRITQQPIVGLVFRREAAARFSRAAGRFRMEDQDTRQGVRPIHQRGRSLEDFDRMDAGTIDLDAMLVAPLLSFLPDAVIHDDDPVVAHAADDRFGDAASGSDFTQTRLCSDGADDVASCAAGKVGRPDHRDRCGHFFHFGVPGQAGDGDFFDLQMLVENIRRVRNTLLSGRCHAYG